MKKTIKIRLYSYRRRLCWKNALVSHSKRNNNNDNDNDIDIDNDDFIIVSITESPPLIEDT